MTNYTILEKRAESRFKGDLRLVIKANNMTEAKVILGRTLDDVVILEDNELLKEITILKR